MSYFGFLAIFLGIPIAALAVMVWLDWRNGRTPVSSLRSWPVWAAVGLHVLIAVAYTTPWDNYLVATRVWWYDPALVTGVTIGWVPIEEYTFFVLQPILAGLWLVFLASRLDLDAAGLPGSRLRVLSTTVVGIIWLGAVAILLSRWQPGTYLSLELGWALPPIALQLAFGADILWRYRRLVLWTLLPATLYLSAADALAISSGTWTINPAQSLDFLLGGVLPIEEFLFFLLTNTLLTFGVILILARESHIRLRRMLSKRPASGSRKVVSRGS